MYLYSLERMPNLNKQGGKRNNLLGEEKLSRARATFILWVIWAHLQGLDMQILPFQGCQS